MRTFNRLLPLLICASLLLSACNLAAVSNPDPTAVAQAAQTVVAQTEVAKTAIAQTVAAELTFTAPQATETPPAPTITNTSPPPPTAALVDKAAFVSETIEDGTSFLPNTAFTKIWRLRNVGTTTWTSSYSLVFDHGDPLGAPASLPLPGAVAPGGEIDLSVNMVAPATPGTYIGYWRLRNTAGVLFYTDSTTTFLVQIAVTPPTPTFTATGGILIPLVPGLITTMIPLLLPKIEWKLNQVTVAANSVGYATATCPSGSVVTGGGFAASADMVVYTSMMEGNGWRVYAKNTAAANKLLNAYAICLSNTSGTTTQKFTQVTAAVGNFGHPVVSCPAGSVVTGGGFASNADNLWVYNSSQSGNGWQVYARNLSGSNQLVNAYAICLSGTSGATSQTVSNISISAGTNDGKQVACPSGLATGGGFALQDDLILYNSSNDDTSGWEGYARNTGGSNRIMNVYVTCLTFP